MELLGAIDCRETDENTHADRDAIEVCGFQEYEPQRAAAQSNDRSHQASHGHVLVFPYLMRSISPPRGTVYRSKGHNTYCKKYALR